jgi:hypothetical protein
MSQFDKTCKYYKSCGHEMCHNDEFYCEDYLLVGTDGYFGEEVKGVSHTEDNKPVLSELDRLRKENEELRNEMATAVVDGNKVMVSKLVELCDRVALAEIQRDTSVKQNVKLLHVAAALLEYIDALPEDVVAKLPAMPGIERDYVETVLEG